MRLLSHVAFLVLNLLFAISPTHAALKFEDRKPINSGMWFDPSRSGEGFELRAVRGEVFIVWFAYDDAGKPIWYAAQGELKTGLEVRYALQKYSFQNGRASAQLAGELVFKNVTSTRIDLSFTLGTATGRRTLLQLEPSANAAEIDHSGQWYQPGKSGYGLGLSESENAGMAALYLYDKNGTPTWLFAGQTEPKSTIYELVYYTGSCPNCAYARPSVRAGGRLTLEFPNPDQLIASIQAPDAGAEFQLTRVPLTRLTPSANALAANRSLVAAPDAISLQKELFEASKTVFPTSSIGDDFFGFSASPTARFSTPNLIAQNVDEAISLRTDGDFVYAINAAQTAVRVLQYQSGTLVFQREISLQAPIERPAAPGQAVIAPRISSDISGVILHQDDIIVSRGSVTNSYPTGVVSFLPPPGIFQNGRTLIELIKKSGAAPARSIEIEGVLMATRKIDNQLYVLTRSTINAYQGLTGTPQERTTHVQALPVEKFLPSIWINGVAQPALGAPNVYSPPVGVPPGNQYIVLTQIDLDKPLAAPGTIKSTAVLGQLTSFYFSERYLTIATNRFHFGSAAFEEFRTLARPYSTELHRFALKSSGVEYLATGSVDGILDLSADRAAQRFGEKLDELRVVTTANGQPRTANNSPNRLSIMVPSVSAPNLLKTLSTLPNAAQPAPIGKPGESLFGTRFVGDRLYAVTFLRTDPLYVIDLSDSAKPKIAAELEIPGFSNYLYPVGSNYLLGVGNDAQQVGQVTQIGGLQLSLFDVSNASRPNRVSNIILGGVGSYSALFSSHLALSAISIDANQTHFSLPAAINFSDTSQNYSGLLQLEISHGSNPSMTLNTPLKPSHADAAQGAAATNAARSSARGLYLRDLRVYLENGRIWYQRGDQVFGPL
jgi:hypothetical protein